MKRSMQDRWQLLLQESMQLKGVQVRPVIPKVALDRGVHVRAAQQPLARRQRLVVPAFEFPPSRLFWRGLPAGAGARGVRGRGPE